MSQCTTFRRSPGPPSTCPLRSTGSIWTLYGRWALWYFLFALQIFKNLIYMLKRFSYFWKGHSLLQVPPLLPVIEGYSCYLKVTAAIRRSHLLLEGPQLLLNGPRLLFEEPRMRLEGHSFYTWKVTAAIERAKAAIGRAAAASGRAAAATGYAAAAIGRAAAATERVTSHNSYWKGRCFKEILDPNL